MSKYDPHWNLWRMLDILGVDDSTCECSEDAIADALEVLHKRFNAIEDRLGITFERENL